MMDAPLAAKLLNFSVRQQEAQSQSRGEIAVLGRRGDTAKLGPRVNGTLQAVLYMRRECWLVPLAYALLGIVFFPVAEWLPTQPFGTGLLMSLGLLYLLPVAIAVVCLPGLVFAALLGSARQITCLFFLFALAGFVGAFCGTRLGDIARMSGMRAFAQRSDALVSAIHQYERDNSEPPSSLDTLIPKYLESEPTTGMAAYPEYKYHCGTEAVERFHGNHWALSVDTPRNVFKYDMMVYLPNQNYPEYAHGGFLKRVGTWAYVDE